MTDAKTFGKPLECGGNLYEDTATETDWALAGWQQPVPPLAAAALAALQASAEAKAKAAAIAQMNTIAAYTCPRAEGCGHKVSSQKDLVGKAQWVGAPKLEQGAIDIRGFVVQADGSIGIGPIVSTTYFKWVQEAQQDYSVVVECGPQG